MDNLDSYRPLCHKILGCAFKVRKKLGKTLREKVYQKALAHELAKAGISFTEFAPIKIIYEGVEICDTEFADFLIEDSIILELKAIPRTSDDNVRQLMTYLAFGKYKLGYLMNFGATTFTPDTLSNFEPTNGLYRIIKPSDFNFG